jgi:hypothetical protein
MYSQIDGFFLSKKWPILVFTLYTKTTLLLLYITPAKSGGPENFFPINVIDSTQGLDQVTSQLTHFADMLKMVYTQDVGRY